MNESPPRILKLSLSLKLLLISEAMLLIAIVALLIPFRRQMHQQIVEDMTRSVHAMATIASLQLDGDLVQQVRTQEDVDSPAFLMARDALNRIRIANGLLPEHINILYRDGDTMRFGIMTQDQPFIGEPHPLHWEMMPTLDLGIVNVSHFYENDQGQWISAYAPVRNSSGAVVGLLQLDHPAEEPFTRYHVLTRLNIMLGLIALGVSSIVGWFVLNMIVIRPMRALRGGMVALARQDFRHRVKLRTRDEFQELAETFNHMSEQLNAARSVQRSFIPKTLPNQSGYRIAAATEPCEATAGDYFDAFALDEERVAVLVADVTGHGLGPSLLMSACRSALRALSQTDLPPAQVLERLDALLREDLTEGRFITMIFGVLHAGGTFTFANAGHGPALVVTESGCQDLPAHRPPLGIQLEEPEEAQQTTIRLRRGERIFLCSDGVSEAMNARDEQFSIQRIERIIRDLSLDQDQVVRRIHEALRDHCGASLFKDDVTILCVDRVSEEPTEPSPPLPIDSTREASNDQVPMVNP